MQERTMTWPPRNWEAWRFANSMSWSHVISYPAYTLCCSDLWKFLNFCVDYPDILKKYSIDGNLSKWKNWDGYYTQYLEISLQSVWSSTAYIMITQHWMLLGSWWISGSWKKLLVNIISQCGFSLKWCIYSQCSKLECPPIYSVGNLVVPTFPVWPHARS